jgi:F-type H+-transporting ATPase subunit a
MASGNLDAAAHAVDRSQQVQDFVMHHVRDIAGHWPVGGFHLPLPAGLTLHMVLAPLVAVLLVLLFVFKVKKGGGAQRGLGNLLESMVVFVRDEISVAYLGQEDGRKMAPLFLNFFFFILSFNLIGLIPGFSAVTGNFSATLALAAVSLLFMTVGAILKNGPSGFFHAFVPHGLPIPILLLVVPLEVIGVFIKSFVLALRLFANMMAGHTALFSILGLAVGVSMWMAPVSLGLGLFVFMLELLVAFLQAYIFTMLSAMFIGQIYHPEH